MGITELRDSQVFCVLGFSFSELIIELLKRDFTQTVGLLAFLTDSKCFIVVFCFFQV